MEQYKKPFFPVREAQYKVLQILKVVLVIILLIILLIVGKNILRAHAILVEKIQYQKSWILNSIE